MKFTSLLSVVLAFARSAVNAKREPATLEFMAPSSRFPSQYRIRASLHHSLTSHDIILRANEPRLINFHTLETRGVVEYNQLPTGRYDAIINDNDANGGDKTFRINLSNPGAEFCFEGMSVTVESVDNLPAYGYVQNHQSQWRNQGAYKQ